MFYLSGVIAKITADLPLSEEQGRKLLQYDSALAAIAMLVLVFSMFNPVPLSVQKACKAILFSTIPLFMLANACGGPVRHNSGLFGAMPFISL